MSFPHILTSLTEREAIVDALYRALLGFDVNDYSLFKSAFSEPDAVVEISENAIQGTEAIRTKLYDLVAAMDTTHMISNVRIEVKDGASVAFLSAYSLAQHCPLGKGQEPEGPKYTGGTIYLIDLVKDENDGIWKIKKWAMNGIWGQGDKSVMEGIL